MKKLILAGLLLLVSVVAANATIYSVDDGTGEVGVGGTGSNLVWGNNFNTGSGGEVITKIHAAFGVSDYTSLNGTSLTASLWNDPNGDGNPNDAILLASVAGVISNWGTDTFNAFDIPDTFVSGSFFAAISLNDAQNFPARFDASNSGISSWIGIDTSMQNANYHNIDFGWGGFMIRAEGDAAPVPEPSTFLLLGAGLGGFALYRRRMKK